MLSFRTSGYNGYGVRYLPFFDNKLAVAAAANYGLVGNGKLFVLSIDDGGRIRQDTAYDTQDGLFDVAWSEVHENQVAAACGDGLVKLFDLAVPRFPVQNFAEHTREVFLVRWNDVDKGSFATLLWDGSIKVWTPARAQSVATLRPETDASARADRALGAGGAGGAGGAARGAPGTAECVYAAGWSPHSPHTLVSCTGALRLQVWDLRAARPQAVDFVAHGGLECLLCDWNKYKPTVVASAGTDKAVRVWDLRMVGGAVGGAAHQAFHTRGPTPLNELLGHEFAVRRVAWSPHSSQELLSALYDMSARVWRDRLDERARFLGAPGSGCAGVMRRHREFVVGCDYSLWGEPGWAATAGWDEMVYVWDTKRL